MVRTALLKAVEEQRDPQEILGDVVVLVRVRVHGLFGEKIEKRRESGSVRAVPLPPFPTITTILPDSR
jgi:hypothetical protein